MANVNNEYTPYSSDSDDEEEQQKQHQPSNAEEYSPHEITQQMQRVNLSKTKYDDRSRYPQQKPTPKNNPKSTHIESYDDVVYTDSESEDNDQNRIKSENLQIIPRILHHKYEPHDPDESDEDAQRFPKMYNYKFIQNPWNRWDPENWKEPKAYSIVNKPGGLGNGNGKKPTIRDLTNQRRGGRDRGRGGYGGGYRGRGGRGGRGGHGYQNRGGRGYGGGGYQNNNNRGGHGGYGGHGYQNNNRGGHGYQQSYPGNNGRGRGGYQNNRGSGGYGGNGGYGGRGGYRGGGNGYRNDNRNDNNFNRAPPRNSGYNDPPPNY